MRRSGRRSIGAAPVALLLASVALVASVAPVARAGDPPALKETSVDSGWTRDARALAARYYDPITDASWVTVVDRSGAEVSGRSAVSGSVLTFVPDAPFDGDAAPYIGTFHATSLAPDPGSGEEVVTFRVDTQAPRAPALDYPAPAVRTPEAARSASGGAIDVNVVLPIGPSPRVFGTARDVLGPSDDDTETSGVARIELRFFPAPGTAEAKGERIVLTESCGIRCPSATWFDTETTLGIGVWTMRAFAFDLAGTQSASSMPLTFVVR